MYAKSPFHANRNRPSAGGRQLTVSWGSAATATDYTLDREHNSAGWLTLEEGTAQSFMRTASAVQGDIYRYQARGCNAAGCGPWSATATVTVLASGGGGCLGGGVCPPPRAPMVDSPPVAPAGDTGALVVATAYNAQGYPEKLTRTSDDYAYLTITAMDAYGHATTVVEGNGVTVTRGYDQATGLALSTLASGTHGTIAHLTTTWDGFGNLHERDDARNDSTETATYDDLNRLKTTNLVYHNFAGGGTLTRSFIYDATGNRTQACNDSDCTTYGYGENGYGPHAVTSMDGGGDYAYNADGEMTADGNKSLTWAAFGKATQITTSTATVTLAYGPGESRYQKTVTGATTETVTYLGSAERLTVNGQTSIRRTLSLGGIGVIDTGGATVQLLYPVSDHLGSVMAMSNGSGELAQEMSYAPFGQRRTAGWASAMGITQALTINTTETDKGYTGQESLDSVSLVDYNARLYDPALGRFLSVDPLIAHPGSTQSINPYSYVENNPLNKTDPTGQASAGGQVCTGSGKTRTCTTTTTTTRTITPTGSHIPQTTTSKTSTTTVGGKVTSNTTTTSGAGALPGGRVETSTDGNSSYQITAKVTGPSQGAKPASTRFNKNTHSTT
ncbi:MAG: RHS repeat-associated core domain-containing protein, partial [Gammaproteobacteria bacterium]